MIGKYVIVRDDMAGVFFGILEKKEGTELTLKNARKVYYWSGAYTIEDLATQGVKNPDNCQITVAVDLIVLRSFDQLIPCTEDAIVNLKNVPVWKI